ncbi:MAG: CvpA family protein [Pseudomonadota bacterium]
MTSFDLFVLACIAFSAFLGWHRGALREIVTLIAIAAGFAAIGLLGAQLSGMAEGTLLKIAALGVLFIAGYLVVALGGSYGVRLVAGAEKQQGDRIAGGIFGALRGWLIGAFAFYTVSVYHTGAPLPVSLSDSLFAPALAETVDVFLRNADLQVWDLSNGPLRAISSPSV